MSKKEVRRKFKEEVFKRDNNTCKVCGKQSTDPNIGFDAHHITDRNEMPNGGYVKENGITVCKDDCHMKVEKYHISGGTEYNMGLHPDDLYKKIESSYEKAYKISENSKGR